MSRREKKKHYIEVSDKVFASLKAVFDVDDRTIKDALDFVRDSSLALRIRSLALQKGGVEMVALPADELARMREG